MEWEREYLCLEFDLIPCWYEISWNNKNPAIIVKIHKDFLPVLFGIDPNSRIITSLMTDFRFSCFSTNIKEGVFGFENVFRRTGKQGDFINFSVEIPLIEIATAEPCRRCKGKKKDEFGVCYSCNGHGQETHLDWKTAYAISATFTCFFMLASLRTKKTEITSCNFPQLILVDTITIRDMHGGSLSGAYSIPLVNYLKSLPVGTRLEPMTTAMITAYKKMFGGLRKFEQHDFRTEIHTENGWLNVSCPGDACGLNPADPYDRRETTGYKFSCHNVDNPMQQLTLLAGLAALCDETRKWLTTKPVRI